MRRLAATDLSGTALAVGLAAVALGANVGPAAAQGADRNRMTEGDSVRIRLEGRMTVNAAFRGWQGDGIVLDVNGFAEPYPVALSDMQRLDAYMMRTRRESFRHGALLGAASGLFIGAGVGIVLHTTGVIAEEDGPPPEIVTDALTWMGLGLVGGTLFGGFYAGTHPGLGWIEVQLPVS